jgi:hypothetical protein
MPTRVGDAAAQQELIEPVTTSHYVRAGIVPSATQVTNGFVSEGRRMHLGEQIGPKQLCEFARIATIRFDAVARLPRNE